MSENCSCKNKEVAYVCKETPTGSTCTPVKEAPKCFTQKVTFFKVD